MPDVGDQVAVGELAGLGLATSSPLATTFWRTRSQSMPRPSSLTVITTLLPRCDAMERDGARARLAGRLAIGRAARARGRPRSGPCGSAGRRARRSSACPARSSRRRSGGSPPCRRRWLRSRITRRNRSNSGPIGTIRVSSTPFCSPSETRPRLWIASESALSCSRASRMTSSSWIGLEVARAAEQLLQPPCAIATKPGLGDHQLAGQVHQVVEPDRSRPADRLGDLAPSCRPARCSRRSLSAGSSRRSDFRRGLGGDGPPAARPRSSRRDPARREPRPGRPSGAARAGSAGGIGRRGGGRLVGLDLVGGIARGPRPRPRRRPGCAARRRRSRPPG